MKSHYIKFLISIFDKINKKRVYSEANQSLSIIFLKGNIKNIS